MRALKAVRVPAKYSASSRASVSLAAVVPSTTAPHRLLDPAHLGRERGAIVELEQVQRGVVGDRDHVAERRLEPGEDERRGRIREPMTPSHRERPRPR